MKKTSSLLTATLTATLLSSSLALVAAPVSAALPVVVEGQALPSLAPMLERTTPAVVSVAVSGTQVSTQQVPEVFRYFFGPNAPQQQVREIGRAHV